MSQDERAAGPCPDSKARNIGFISTRLAGTDGVSLETRKWIRVCEAAGHHCYYLAGEVDHPPERSMVVPRMHFKHDEIHALHKTCFDSTRRPPEISRRITEIKEELKDAIYTFVERFEIDLIVAENCLAIPMNIPLGLALTQFIAETGFHTLAHHHDFFWERKRFLFNAVWDYLNMCFPPHLPSIEHTVINSSADNQLSLRTGISATLIPNVMDFETRPIGVDEYNADVREALGLQDDELLILQPTRVVKRKGIEHAIELVARLGLKARLVISHASGDEGYGYENRLREYARLLGVEVLWVSDIINDRRGRTPDGRKIYKLEDIYPHADLVTYPSDFEGFGNAFLETIYFRKPIVVNNYSIYMFDIRPLGFRTIELDDYVTEEALDLARRVLVHEDLRNEMVEHNYNLGLQHFSYSVLRSKLLPVVARCVGDRSF